MWRFAPLPRLSLCVENGEEISAQNRILYHVITYKTSAVTVLPTQCSMSISQTNQLAYFVNL